MCTVMTSKVPKLTQFLAMTNDEILKLPVNNCLPSELYKGISYQANHPVTKQVLALKYFLHNLEGSTERAELFETVIPKLKESLSELLQSGQLDEITVIVSSVSSTLCDTVDSTGGDSSEVLQRLVIGVLDLLLQLHKLTFERERTNKQIDKIAHLNKIFVNVTAIHSKLFDFVTSKEVNYFSENFSNVDVTFINKLIVILCKLAEFASKSGEVKFLAAVWRCITAFCIEKLPNSRSRFAANYDGLNRFEFLLTVVKTACFCIQYGLQEICEPSDPSSEGKFHNRLMAFTTVVLHRLTVTYPHDKFKGHGHVLTTLLVLMSTIRTHSKPNQFLNQSLTVGLQNVLLSIFRCDEFVESFHSASCDEFSIELLHIGLELLKKLIDTEDTEGLNFLMKRKDLNIVCKLIDCMSIDPSTVFNKNQMHPEPVALLSNILIKTSTKISANIVPQLLVEKLLECDNTLMGYFLINVWNTWTRCLSEEQCFHLILFWSEINEKFSIVQPLSLPSIHVKILLRNLYDHLSEPYKMKLLSMKRPTNKVKLWTALGLHRIEKASIEIADLHVKIVELYKSFVAERSECSLYRLIEHLRLLETMSQSNDPVPDYLIELWNLNFSHQPNKYSPLIISLIRIAILYQHKLNNSQHCQIIQKLSAIVGKPNVTDLVKLETLNYLRHIAIKYFTVEYQKDILKSIRQLFNKSLIDSDPIVQKAAFIIYARVIVEAQHEDIQPDHITDDENVKKDLFNFINKHRIFTKSRDEQMIFLQQLSTTSLRHECVGTKLLDDRSQENDSNEDRVKEIINRMQSDTKELMELNQKNRLAEEFCKIIEGIRQELALIQ